MEELSALDIIPLQDILTAKDSAPTEISNTPVIPLHKIVKNKKIYLKLENVQPVGSFKVRGAYNAISHLRGKRINNTEDKTSSNSGVYTSSAGNFAQGLCWAANTLSIPVQVIVPENVARVKLNAIKNFDADIITLPYNDWWNVMLTGKQEKTDGMYIHPCCNKTVMAGNGVIGLEILQQVPDVDSIVCAYGGGGHSLGIASAVKHVRPDTKVYACEVETATPLFTSFQNGRPVVLDKYESSFVDGMNGKAMFPCMWNMACHLLSGSVVTSLREICDALKTLCIDNHVVSEGAGAATVAAAMKDEIPGGSIVCVVSGGNIDTGKLVTILNGDIPSA